MKINYLRLVVGLQIIFALISTNAQAAKKCDKLLLPKKTIIVDVATGYRLISKVYDTHHKKNVMLLLEELSLSEYKLELMEGLPKADSVMDIGVGTGRDIEILESRFNFVVGVDLSREMIFIAMNKANSPRTSFMCCDFMDVETNDKFNFVHFTMSLKYFKSLTLLFKKIASLMDQGSVLYLADTSDKQLLAGSRPRFQIGDKEISVNFYIHRYNSIIKAMKKAGLKIVDAGYIPFDERLLFANPQFEKYVGKDILYYFVAKK